MAFSTQDLRLGARVAAEIDRICAWLRDTVLATQKRRGVVLGLSGGIDSSVVASLAVRALGADRVLGLFMNEGESADDTARLSRLVADHLQIATANEDLSPILDAAGCYARRDEAIRSVIPRYAPGWKCKIVLPSLLASDQLRVF